jgi:outer membrane immunogenic protein
MSYPLRGVALSIGITSGALLLSLGSAAAQGAPPPPNPAFGGNSASASSWLAGGHAGYNWQSGAAVFGVETDLQGTHLNSSMNGGLTHSPPLTPPPAGDFAMTSATIDWYGTFRGRLGWAFGPWMLYGTGGLAYGNVGLNSSFGTLGQATGVQASSTKVGWVAGAGIDYWISPNLTFNLLYQHVDLGSLSATSGAGPFATAGGTFSISQMVTAHAQFDAVMAGLTWRFSPTGLYGSWVGAYVGGQGGGAWGNDTRASYSSMVTATPPVPSDARLKRDITLVGVRNDGLGIYSYRYLWSDTTYVGVIAQEVALIHPEALVRDELTGYLSVDYGRLGLPLMMLQ